MVDLILTSECPLLMTAAASLKVRPNRLVSPLKSLFPSPCSAVDRRCSVSSYRVTHAKSPRRASGIIRCHNDTRYSLFDAVHAQGGLTGYAHVAWAIQLYRKGREETFATWDSTINVPRDKVDFLEILQFRLLGLEDYYDFLNLGYKLTASAGSDIPWGNTIGEVRMYVYTGPNFTADAWFDSMKAGRTFVTNGPMVELAADGVPVGGEVKVGKNVNLRIKARAWAPPSIGAPKTLEIVSHGRVIHSVESHNTSTQELKADFSLKVEASQWIAARVTSQNGALAHTSPVYVIVDGQNFRNQKDLPELVARRLKVLDYITGRLHDAAALAKDQCSPSEVEALMADIADARARYQGLLSSS